MASGTMVEITTNMEGLEALIARLPGQTEAVAESWAKRCLDVAQARVPRRSGYLASTGAAGTNHAPTMAEGFVEYTAPYSLVVEMGGGRRVGHHFLESSADQSAAGFLAECAGLLV